MDKKTGAKEKAAKDGSAAKRGKKDIKDPGFGVKAPSSSCTDRKCPFHGDLKVRGRTFTGIVTRSKAQRTAQVSWERRHYIPKYERYERRRTKLQAHNPPCINADEGDIIRMIECRPLSKTKNFVIVEKLGRKEIKMTEDVLGEEPHKKQAKKEEGAKEAKKEEKKKQKVE